MSGNNQIINPQCHQHITGDKVDVVFDPPNFGFKKHNDVSFKQTGKYGYGKDRYALAESETQEYKQGVGCKVVRDDKCRKHQ